MKVRCQVSVHLLLSIWDSDWRYTWISLGSSNQQRSMIRRYLDKRLKLVSTSKRNRIYGWKTYFGVRFYLRTNNSSSNNNNRMEITVRVLLCGGLSFLMLEASPAVCSNCWNVITSISPPWPSNHSSRLCKMGYVMIAISLCRHRKPYINMEEVEGSTQLIKQRFRSIRRSKFHHLLFHQYNIK